MLSLGGFLVPKKLAGGAGDGYTLGGRVLSIIGLWD